MVALLAGPTARTVLEFGAICVRPASCIRHVFKSAALAARSTCMICSSLSTLTAIFALPDSSHRFNVAGFRRNIFSYAPTAAWPHWAPILPLPIFKSFRTTSTIFMSPLSKYGCTTVEKWVQSISFSATQNAMFVCYLHVCATMSGLRLLLISLYFFGHIGSRLGMTLKWQRR